MSRRIQVGAVREAVANYGRYRELTEEYAALAERQTREARTAGGAKKKGFGNRLRRKPAGK